MAKLYGLKSLVADMGRHKKYIEQFYVTFNNVRFDIVLDIESSPFELMIGAVGMN